MKTFACWFLSKISILSGIGFVIIAYTIAAVTEGNKETGSIIDVLVFMIPIDISLSCWAAIFTYQNFDEIYSKRMRWRNSNVEKLDSQISYSIKMFLQCLTAIPAVFMIIWGIIFFSTK